MLSPFPAHLMLRALGVAAVVLVLSGCRIDPRVDIDVDADGGGIVRVTVALDADAVAEIGDASLVRLDDIRRAGWDVPSPEPDGGGVTFRASKRFASREQLQSVLDEVGGPGGLFRGFHLDVDDSWTGTTYSLAGTLHSTGSVEQLSDVDVAKVLDGLPLGRTPGELATDVGTGEVRMVVAVHLPGGTTGSAESSVVVSGGNAGEQPLAISSELDKAAPVWWLVGSALAALVALGCLVVARRTRKAPADPAVASPADPVASNPPG